MTRKKMFLIVESLLTAALAACWSAAAIGLYRAGLAQRAEGDVLAPSFSRELLTQAGQYIAPLLYVTAGLGLLGLLLGVRDARATKIPTVYKTGKPLSDKAISVLRAWLLLAAAAMIVAGVCNGGMRDVLVKAVNLCTECVGLG